MIRYLLAMGVLGLMALLLATGSQGAASAQLVSIQEQIDSAQPGDTLTFDGGVYNERVVIDKPLTLMGVNDPVIDGGGDGDVVTITADDVTLSRFVIRNGGQAFSQEPAAVKIVDAHAPVIEHNRIEDARFGIHVTGSHHAVIDNNEIDLGDMPIERRGHGIYFWEVAEGAIHGNEVTNAGDGIHLEFSSDNGIALNTVTGSRYALHFMYSDNNRILQNTFTDNLSGAVLMFSHELLLKDNELSGNRQGATGTGILLKDVDNVFVEGNTIIRNKYGLTADGAPQSVGATVTLMRNLFALNDTGLGLMTSAPITFIENSMIENTVQVEALGAGLIGDAMAEAHDAGAQGTTSPDAASGQAIWSIGGRGNYWSDYRGYDADGDGIGDRPYRPDPAFGGAMEEHPNLRFFQFTLAQQAIDTAAEMFPVYDYDPVIEDAAPLMSPIGPALPEEAGVNTDLLVTSGLLVLLAAVILQFSFDFDPIAFALARGRRIAGPFNRGAA